GQFPSTHTFRVSDRPSFLIVGDTNDDGNQDLVVGSELSESVAILLGTGVQLAEPTTNHLSGTAKPSAAEDFDRDGQMDLVNPDESGGAIQILPGVSEGHFGKALHVTVGRDPHALVTADFDHDGRIDIAVAHRSSQTIAILLNRSPAPTPAPRHGGRASARP
ncbi:MAG: FG-GAP repeat domain-containing protein, partial [Bradyrhizobium sp.]